MSSGSGSRPVRVRTLEPSASGIEGVQVLPRTIHQDARGFLVETLRRDDAGVDGARFAMSYTSVTLPGEMRDRDRWHVHRRQQDRFVVTLGEMVLALYDARGRSASHGTLQLLRMTGASPSRPAAPEPRDMRTHLVTVPEGVYHAIANLHAKDPFVLQNFPTQLYDQGDEGRVPFSDQPIGSLGGRGFSWDLVEVVR